MKSEATMNVTNGFLNPYSLEALDEAEVREWVESLEEVIEREGPN